MTATSQTPGLPLPIGGPGTTSYDVRLRCRCCVKGTVGAHDWRERCARRATGEDGLCDMCREFQADRFYMGHRLDVPGIVTHVLLPMGSPHSRPEMSAWPS